QNGATWWWPYVRRSAEAYREPKGGPRAVDARLLASTRRRLGRGVIRRALGRIEVRPPDGFVQHLAQRLWNIRDHDRLPPVAKPEGGDPSQHLGVAQSAIPHPRLRGRSIGTAGAFARWLRPRARCRCADRRTKGRVTTTARVLAAKPGSTS